MPQPEHWAANSADPIAIRARCIISDRYDGAPPWRTPIPMREWDEAVAQAREMIDPADARPMTGLISTLTPEQLARALAYDGPDSHGDPAFALKQPARAAKEGS